MEGHINDSRTTTPPAARSETSVNHYPRNFDTTGPDSLDRLLADIAIRIQLSRTDYDKAVRRYKRISEWIEREASRLRGLVELFYAQGSMAIGATIAARGTDEFDVDVVVQLRLAGDVSPETPLNMLYAAIRGDEGSRYYQMTTRRTRCVTVEYHDGMHIDFTPAIRRWHAPERESWIFHDRPEAPHDPSHRLIANPYGFAEWFKERTPPNAPFVDFYFKRSSEYERTLLKAQADAEPVPPQQPPFKKSTAAIALQLLKRWRNVRYESRSGRRPPSIVIAKLVADAATPTTGLAEELLLQAEHLLAVFQTASSQNRLIRITNPVCEQDVLTDRWPSTLAEQATFLNDLTDLVDKVRRLHHRCDLGEMKRIMIELFGEAPTERVFSDYNQSMGALVRGGSRHIPESGSLGAPARTGNGTGAAAAVVAGSSRTPKHTFYGSGA